MAVRVGGDFFFDPQPEDASRNLVLIAGGVGINPLLSILRHSVDLHRERENKGSGYEMGTTKLFYSAKNTSELLFQVRETCLLQACCEQTWIMLWSWNLPQFSPLCSHSNERLDQSYCSRAYISKPATMGYPAQ